MFDLKTEIAAWSEAAHADRCRGSERTAELVDHLHCEIDRARADGLSDEAAFKVAVAKVGDGNAIAAEHAKNRSWIGTLCALAAREERLASGARGPLLAHAVLWSALIVATAIVLSADRALSSTMLLMVMVPGWLASHELMRATLRRARGGRSR